MYWYVFLYTNKYIRLHSSTFHTYNTYRYMPYIPYMPIRTIQTIQAIHAYTIKYISLHTNSYNTYHTYQYILYIHIHTYTYQYIQYIPYIPIHAIRTDTCQYLPIPALMNTYRYMPYVPIHTNTCNTYHCQYVHQYVPSWYIPIRTKIHAKIHTHTYQYMFTDSIRANTSIAHPWCSCCNTSKPYRNRSSIGLDIDLYR